MKTIERWGMFWSDDFLDDFGGVPELGIVGQLAFAPSEEQVLGAFFCQSLFGLFFHHVIFIPLSASFVDELHQLFVSLFYLCVCG
jgi:hypothetical protein